MPIVGKVWVSRFIDNNNYGWGLMIMAARRKHNMQNQKASVMGVSGILAITTENVV